MRQEEVALYEEPWLYDMFLTAGPCERFYRGLAERTGGPILELACGTARLSLPLAADGHEIVALDSSAAMLRAARRKAETAGVAIAFVNGDMRSFDLGRTFALAIVSCNSLCHLSTNEELIGALSGISRHLAPGGLLAFDVVNPRMADLARVGRTSVRRDILADGAVRASEELLGYDPVGQIQVLRWEIAGEQGGSCRTEEMRLRTIFPQELPLLLAAAGLELVARFGDFDGTPLTGNSLNQVCIARQARKGARQ